MGPTSSFLLFFPPSPIPIAAGCEHIGYHQPTRCVASPCAIRNAPFFGRFDMRESYDPISSGHSPCTHAFQLPMQPALRGSWGCHVFTTPASVLVIGSTTVEADIAGAEVEFALEEHGFVAS